MMSQRMCQIYVVLCFVAAVAAEENNYQKVWSLSSARSNDGSSVVNVTSASIVIQPSSYTGNLYVPARQSRDFKTHQTYAFKPRAVPIRKSEPQERSVYYSQDNVKKYKSEVLFPGNYFPIAKEKSNESAPQEKFNPLEGGPFHPKAIPLMRGYVKRSLDLEEEEESGTEKPRSFSDAVAQRRSISYALGLEDEDENEDVEDQDYEVEEDAEDTRKSSKSKNKLKIKTHKYRKYMLPLLMAYKMKYFALVPVMVGGLILLVGATGLAGFFFALFAAVMGLQKGGGY